MAECRGKIEGYLVSLSDVGVVSEVTVVSDVTDVAAGVVFGNLAANCIHTLKTDSIGAFLP